MIIEMENSSSISADRLSVVQVRIHDLKRLHPKAGSSLVGLPRMDCGILFSTYDMLISGGKQTAAQKARALAALTADKNFDAGQREFGATPS